MFLVGTGAVGSLYGGKIAQSGVRVTALCRSDYSIVKKKGIEVSSIWGDFHFRPDGVVRRAGELKEIPDIILVALKVLPEIDAPGLIREAVGPDTAIVLLQNGVEIEKAMAAAFPENEIISGLSFVCASRAALGKVLHLDYGRLVFGNYPSGISPKTRELSQRFRSVGVPCQSSRDVATERWKKLVWNAPFNPLSVLGGGIDTREIMESGELARLAREVMEEVRSIARAAGHALPRAIVEDNIRDTLRMKPYKTSMCLDFEEGRPLEVEGILGNAVRAARREGVAAPRLETLYALLTYFHTKTQRHQEL